jgi:hypothetical protein
VLSEKKETLMKGIVVWGFAVTLCTLVSIQALAADKSDVAARAATWEKEYNADNLHLTASRNISISLVT